MAAGWSWAVLTVAGWLIVVNPIQTQLDYELAARLMALDQRLDPDEAP